MQTKLNIAFYMSFILLLPSLGWTQDEISEIPFESVPGDTQFVVGGGETIGLRGDTAVAGGLEATGEVESQTGFRFPDGTLQLSAAEIGNGSTVHQGIYGNTIADFTPPQAYTEICFKNGGVSSDIHNADEPTAGGSCVPGDIGWIYERFERDAGVDTTWTNARIACLNDGMRLPEPFEWIATCEMAASLAIVDMSDDWEWGSNSVTMIRRSYDSGPDFASLIVPILGNGSCTFATEGNLARNDGDSSTFKYRCVR